MLTRLKVSGFKNLVDVDINFGPVTCIAGVNGVGKSNLFDAITFLSALADKPLLEAALSVRDEGGRTADLRSIFHRTGDSYDDEMSFEAEMIVPGSSINDLGQLAKASITFLRYSLRLAYRAGDGVRSLGAIEIVEEKLEYIQKGAAKAHLQFPHRSTWQDSAIQGKRFGKEFISTDGGAGTISLHQDGGAGRARNLLAATLPRTVLSATNAAESPTALVARNEMRSWRLLQLEPSALRTPDPFTAPTHLGTDGSHLAATLYHLAESRARKGVSKEEGEAEAARVYAQVANRLALLINDVREVWIDRDERRELLTLYLKDRHNTAHAARSLSDGTLRFLALAVLELDPDAQGVLCLEEPENGIHPERIPAMLQLLDDLAVDVDEPIGQDNPLRQIIINTHSPAVVSQIADDDLLMAQLLETGAHGKQFSSVQFHWLADTWRDRPETDPHGHGRISKGTLLAYLDPSAGSVHPVAHENAGSLNGTEKLPHRRRVIDRPDIRAMQPDLWPSLEAETA